MSTPEPEPEPAKEDQAKPANLISIPRESYNAMMQTNQAAMYLTLNTIEKFDYILDELADFEKKVRDMKKQAKDELKLATTTTTTTPSQPPSS